MNSYQPKFHLDKYNNTAVVYCSDCCSHCPLLQYTVGCDNTTRQKFKGFQFIIQQEISQLGLTQTYRDVTRVLYGILQNTLKDMCKNPSNGFVVNSTPFYMFVCGFLGPW